MNSYEVTLERGPLDGKTFTVERLPHQMYFPRLNTDLAQIMSEDIQASSRIEQTVEVYQKYWAGRKPGTWIYRYKGEQ